MMETPQKETTPHSNVLPLFPQEPLPHQHELSLAPPAMKSSPPKSTAPLPTLNESVNPTLVPTLAKETPIEDLPPPPVENTPITPLEEIPENVPLDIPVEENSPIIPEESLSPEESSEKSFFEKMKEKFDFKFSDFKFDAFKFGDFKFSSLKPTQGSVSSPLMSGLRGTIILFSSLTLLLGLAYFFCYHTLTKGRLSLKIIQQHKKLNLGFVGTDSLEEELLNDL